jgi:hypothetical protein
MDALGQNVTYQRRDDYVTRVIAGETVLVPIRQNLGDLESIYTLNEVGTFIWQQLAQPVTAAQVAVAVEEKFEAEPAVIRSDVEEFLRELVSIEAVRVVAKESE